jgi:dTDP-4-amino-4,6-dideoxygalactose transaminase
MSYAIPFNRPCMTGRETEYISEAIDQGHVSGDGPFSKRCHELLEK